jgi:hypothetical protein
MPRWEVSEFSHAAEPNNKEIGNDGRVIVKLGGWRVLHEKNRFANYYGRVFSMPS